MASRIARQLVEGLEEFSRKLRLGIPIPGTRVIRCDCRGRGCKECKGTGVIRRKVILK